MKKTYLEFVRDMICSIPEGQPIYTKNIANEIAYTVEMNKKAAAAAVSVAIKRIMDKEIIPELRIYQKGIYFRTVSTPFGELKINKEQLIADKYLLPNEGYETGLAFMHRIGLTTQMPKERTLVTNAAVDCAREDEKLGVIVRPGKVRVCKDNKDYLQTLDVLDMVERAPVDVEQPYQLLAKHIKEHSLEYEKLLALADEHYTKATVLRIAHTTRFAEARI